MRTRLLLLSVLTSLGLVLGIANYSVTRAHGSDGQASQDEELTPETRVLIANVRGATAPYQDLEAAMDAGYGKFQDCFTLGDEAGMGQHFVNGDLAGDDVLDPLQPEALVYEPREDGEMILVAFEYLVFADVWDPENEGREPPTIFGQELALKTNIPDTPPVWALHLWLYTHNPQGLFADFNPLVFCPEDQPVVDMSAH
jgi:hypothetical protein